MNKIFFVVLFLAAVCCVYCKEYTPVMQCGSEKLFKNVAITTKKGLCKKLPCQFKLGEEIEVEMEFVNKNKIENIVSSCKAKVLGNDVDFPIPNADKGCDYLTNAKCPVPAKTDLEMAFKLTVRPPTQFQFRSGIDASLQFYLHDQNKEVISCFQMTAKVQIF